MDPDPIGRADELSALLGLCHGEQSGMVVVTGCAGSGKTTLLAAMAARLVGSGVRVGSGHAVPGGGSLRALAEALVRIAPPTLACHESLTLFRSVLARVLPTWPPGPAPDAHLVDPVVVLGEAVLELLRVLTSDARTVLVLDDVHWADRDSLALLEYVAGGLPPATAVVAAARDDEAAPAGVEALLRHPEVQRLSLRPLDGDAIAVLARRVVGGAVAPEVAEHLTRVSDGVPLLVEESAAGLVESGALTCEGGVWRARGSLSSIPPRSLSRLVEDRIATLPAATRELVHAAAVLGPELDLRLLAAVCGSDARGVGTALRPAVDAGLMRRDPTGDLRWRHALTCAAVNAALSLPERAAIAAHAATALEADPGVRRGLLADLHARGGRPDLAASLLLDEAREAVARGALAGAHELLGRASILDAGEGRWAVPLAVERIGAFALSARTQEAIAVADGALRTARGADRTAVAVAAARACVAGERFSEAERHLAVADDAGDPRVGALAAHVALHAGDLDRAIGLAHDALAAVDEARTPDVACEALEVVGRALRRRDPVASVQAFERSERLAARHDLLPWRIRSLAELGASDVVGGRGAGRLAEARSLAVDAGMLGTATGLDLQLVVDIIGREGMVTAMGDTQRCADRARRLGLRGIQAHALMLAARCRVYADRAGDADGLLDEVDGLAPSPLYRSARRHGRAIDAWLAGDDDRAVREYDATVEHLRSMPSAPPAPLWGEWLLVRTVRDPGDPGPREEMRGSDVLVQPISRAALAYADAVAAAHSGQGRAAAALLAEGERLVAAKPFFQHQMRLAVVPRAGTGLLGDTPAHLREALAWASERGETRLARLCAAHLRRLELPLPRPGRDTRPVPPRLRALGVTGRELQVMRLAAAGLGNQEIADRLHLSRRTVETHVSSVLQKTGTPSREQLTALDP